MLDPSTTTLRQPEREAEIRRQLTGIATALLDAVLVNQAEAASTDSPASLNERLATQAMRKFLPTIRGMFLARLSKADPVTLERLMGASATAIESILYYAPGEPLPRFVLEWRDEGLTMVPAPAGEQAEPSVGE